MTTKIFSARLLAGVATAALVLTGCASGPSSEPAAPGSSPAASQGEHNDADVMFVQGMIPHHRQAVEMAEMAAGRTENPAVLDLATRIGSGQQPEIDTMTGWLQEWGVEVPAEGEGMEGMSGMEGMEGMEGMDHGGMSGMGGMMSSEQMQALSQASGPAFDRMFLEMMTEHHRGAVEMAETELADGADPDALALAQTIIDTQQAEITEMETLLQQV